MAMETFEELFDKLSELKITQNSCDWSEDIPKDIWNKYFANNFKEVAYNIDPETHRWYETSITVINILGGLLGVRYITNLYSESMDYVDAYHTIKFYVMDKVERITYEPITD